MSDEGMTEDELRKMESEDRIDRMTPVTYVVLIPYQTEDSHICVGHFGSRIDAASFIGEFTSRVDIKPEHLMVGPVYSHADIMELIDEKGGE
jgi:phosphoheptose isomerase